jgi:tripartite-type tricarboxylate transporter receptor subunit TctC
MRRRKALEILTGSALAASAWPVVAQERQGLSRIVVPYAAGGQTDAMARLLAASMETRLRNRVLVDNRPGAAALIGTSFVQSAPANGDTLLFHNSGLVLLPLLQKSATYDPVKDFTAVSMIGDGPLFLMVNESVPARSFSEFLTYARSLPQGVECANSGINSAGHISAMMLEKMAGLKLLHVPYKGSAEVTQALLGGEVKMQLSVTTDSLNPFIRSGKIRILGVATKQRTSLAPDVPPIGDFVPGYAFDVWFGIFAPAHTPLAQREVLSSAIKAALEEPELKARFASLYIDVRHRGPEDFAKVVASSANAFREIVRDLQLTPQ